MAVQATESSVAGARRLLAAAAIVTGALLLGACAGGWPAAGGEQPPEREPFTAGGPAGSSMEPTDVDASDVARVDAIRSRYDAQTTEQGETRLTVPDAVLFALDSAELLPQGRQALDEIAEVIGFHEEAPVAIHGHTDSLGSDAYNQGLSDRRAEAVRRYLVDHVGVDANRLTARGFGESQPAAPNTLPDGSDNPEGRERNRRVEILIDAG